MLFILLQVKISARQAGERARENGWQKIWKEYDAFRECLNIGQPIYCFSVAIVCVFFFRECAQYEKCNEPPNKKDNNSTYERVKQVENEWDFKMNVTKIVYIMEVLSIERDNR